MYYIIIILWIYLIYYLFLYVQIFRFFYLFLINAKFWLSDLKKLILCSINATFNFINIYGYETLAKRRRN
jgi:hypothetical protein